MLVQFFTVIINKTQSLQDLLSLFGNSLPSNTCLEFNSEYSNCVFCVDASIDSAKICADNGFLFSHAHNLDVPIENYCSKYFVGVNFGNPNNYHLEQLFNADISGNMPTNSSINMPPLPADFSGNTPSWFPKP